jgi:hypothetical protein
MADSRTTAAGGFEVRAAASDHFKADVAAKFEKDLSD